MIGSTRQQQTSADSARTPYASPQPAQRAGGRDGAVAVQPLVPFVPREFREATRRDLSATPVSKSPELPFIVPAPPSTLAFASEVALFDAPGETPADARADAGVAYENVDDIARNFSDVESTDTAEIPQGVYDAGSYDASDLETNRDDASDVNATTELSGADSDLPWIDAFAVEGEEAEETWPMGEAGRRLDELTESLSSMDASRSRRKSGENAAQVDPSDLSNGETAHDSNDHSAASAANAPVLPMWNEDEWIDIMPTSMHGMSAHDVSAHDVSAHDAGAPPSSSAVHETNAGDSHTSSADIARTLFDESAFNSARGDVAPPNPGAAITAQALESLAQRIRAGELPVPEVQSDMTQEAVLAGVLASMLGWRQ